jgi:predicted DNA-binding ribbon-helix-helix protein
MRSSVTKHSIVLSGHKTSVSLEEAFWKALKTIAALRGTTLSDLVATIDTNREHANLSSAIRLFILDFYRNRLGERMAGEHVAVLGAAAPDQTAAPSDKEEDGCLGRSVA